MKQDGLEIKHVIKVIETPYLKVAVKQAENAKILTDLIVSRSNQNTLLNRIYAAKVVQIVESLDGVFLDIGTSDNAFMVKRELIKALGLSYGQNKDKPLAQIVKRNQLVLGQVDREPYQGKGAKLKAEISLVGKYFILLPLTKSLKFSKKINKTKLSGDLIDQLTEKSKENGFIVRSQVMFEAEDQVIIEDLNRLIEKWHNLMNNFKLTNKHKCLYESDVFEDDLYRRLYDSSIVAIDVTRDDMRDKLLAQGIAKQKIRLKKWDYSEIKQVLNLVKDLVLSNEFHIFEGSRFTMDELEAFTIIDVDTGKNVSNMSKDDFAFDFNKKIAREISKTLIKRQISGAIIIDFINMSSSLNKAFQDYVEAEVFTSEDDFKVMGFTSLGLLELSRKRSLAPLRETVSYMPEKVDLIYLTLSELDTELLKIKQHESKKMVEVQVEESLYIYLRQNALDENRYGIKIKVLKDKRVFEAFNFQ